MSRPRRRPRPPRMEELEPRILFAADAAALGLGPEWLQDTPPEQRLVDGASAIQEHELASRLLASIPADTPSSAAGTRHELVFIDGGLPDTEALMAAWTQADQADASTSYELIRLDADQDGLTQITAALRGRSGLDAIHIVSHAAPGQLRLGSLALDADGARARAEDLMSWRAAISADADLLLWGCSLAADDHGAALLQHLGDLTGADVAASIDRTGGAPTGGNLLLEAQRGSVGSDLAAAQWALGAWGGELATYTVTHTLDDGSTGSLRWAITQANSHAGTDTISFAIGTQGSAQTITLSSLLPTVTDSVVLDARTQGGSGYAGVMLIRLDGNNFVATGLNVTAGNSTIAGLSITRFTSHGLVLQSGGSNVVEANAIGLDATTLVSNPNGGDGIRIDTSSNNRIGGTTSAQANVITYNGGVGINVIGFTSASNALLGNSIVGNTGHEIDLAGNGITANDGFDLDVGANGLQNTPVISSATVSSSGTTVAGTLNSLSNTTYRIELFSVLPGNAEASGHGGARRMLGSVDVTTDGSGNANFSTLCAAWVNAGDAVTATATHVLGANSYGSTSEFATNRTATSAGGVIVVNTNTDVVDGTLSSLTNLAANRGADARISLREAITAANNTVNGGTPDLIAFDIFGWGPQTITFSYDDGASTDADALPDSMRLTDRVVINGATQPGYAGSPRVFLNGANTAPTGLDINGSGSGGSTVRGLGFQGFTAQALNLSGSNDNTVAGNWFGLDSAGTGAAANARGINLWNASNNLIGGSTAADRNIISGSTAVGVVVNTDSGSSTGNRIQGNYFGTDASGNVAIGNVSQALWINAANTTIGGTVAGQGNVISGTTAWVGLDLTASATGALIAGNLIGLNASGTAALANAGGGVNIASANNVIGGTTAAARNVISGNGGFGLHIFGASATGNVVIGNYIGPDITGTLDINGHTSDSGRSGVVIDTGATNNRVGTNADGVQDAAERNIISGNNWWGVEFIGAGTTGNVAQGNYIGTDVTGLLALGNSEGGASFWNGPSGNRVGGGATGAGNVIAGGVTGVLLANGVTNNQVQGNLIGLGADGSTAVGNTGAGVFFYNGGTAAAVTGNLIGTNADGSNDAAERNVISANYRGVAMQDAEVTGNTLAGNYIGTDATGTVARGNSFDGVYLSNGAQANTVGGSLAAQGNVISGNGTAGITVTGEASDNNVIRGNRIGVNAAGTATIGNAYDGIYVGAGADGTVIGGTGVNEGNWVAGNGIVGIEVDGASTGTLIQGNRIGTDLAGTANWGHAENGVLLEGGASNTAVGGASAGAGNVIAFSGQGGVWDAGIAVSGNTSTGNVFLRNSIYNSMGLGIDLGSNGVTANDLGDADVGPNDLLNTLDIHTATTTGSQLTVTGTYTGAANTYYRIELYSNTDAEASGTGEGRSFLHAINIALGASGIYSSSYSFAGAVATGAYISATVTRTDATYSTFYETSEFSNQVQARAPGITVTSGGPGTTEAGGTAQFSVVLDAAPNSNVTVALSSSDAAEGTLSTTSLVFTPSDWNVAQTVTVTGVDDTLVDGNIAYTVVTAAATSADLAYSGLNAADVALTNSDNDIVNTVIVTTTTDTADGDTSSLAALMANTGADGRISLREAITAANNTANGSGGADRIHFNITDPLVGGAHTITLNSDLAAVTDAVVIDGSTEPDAASGAPRVVLDGNLSATNGLHIQAGDTTVRGLVLQRFTARGILVDNGAANVQIVGNFIGTDVTGLLAPGNGTWGIDLISAGSGVVIGGTGAADRNVIGGNATLGGIAVNNTSGATIIGNAIGVGADGTTALGNHSGVFLLGTTTGTRIGGTGAGEGNVIAHNSGDGIGVWSAASQATVLGNQIFDNAGQGIDLAWDGVVQVNDAGDADTGANGLQNFPVLSAATVQGSQITIAGTLNSAANAWYRIEFFSNSSADASGHGEGQVLLGYANVATDGSGNVSFQVTLNATVTPGDLISATATVADAAYASFGDTSEFAANVTAVNGGGPVNTVPAGQTVNEDTALVFSAANGNAVTVSDGVAGDGRVRVTLSVAQGTLTLAQTTGLSIVGGANGSATMVIDGQESAVNAAMNGMGYLPAANYHGGANLQVSTELSANLLGQYGFDAGTAADSAAGTAQNGSFIGNATTAVDGTHGTVLVLDGSGDSVQIPGTFGNPANVTVAAWVNLASADVTGSEVLSIGDSLLLRIDSYGSLIGGYYNGSTWVETSYNVTLAGTGWHHLAFSVDDAGDMSTLYLDGIAVNSAAGSDSIVYGLGTDTYIGTHGNGSTDYDFHGRIDDARIYDRALTAAEVANIAAGRVSDSDSVAITVAAVNDAPSGIVVSMFPTVNEDDVNPAGRLVSDFTATTTDPDAGALAGIAVHEADNTHGQWQYTLDGGTTWSDITGVSASNALLLPSDALARVRFVPLPDYNGVAFPFSYRAWDQTTGSAGGYADASVTGGSTAFGAAAGSVSTTVLAINDAPVNGLPGAQVTPVNTALVFSAANGNALSVADVDAGVALLQVTLSVTHGNLTLAGTSGLSFSVGDGTSDASMSFTGTVSAINTALNGLSFTPTAAYQGGDTLTLVTNDQGNTGSGGALSDSDTVHIQIGALRFQEGVDGYTGTQDTWVGTSSATTNHGAEATVVADDNSGSDAALLRFDNVFGSGVGQIPLGSTITGATLSIYVTDGDSLDFVALHRMLSAWTEASTYNGLVSGVQANGIEASSSALLSFDAGTTGWVTLSGAQLTAVVQAWADGEANHGFAFISNNADRWTFASSENGSSNLRPYLSINHTPPQAPVVTPSGGAASYTENAAAVSVDSGLTLTDADSTQLTGATVRISANYANGQDVLAFTDQSGITGSWDAGTGTLTLAGTATVAQYQAALRSVSYSNGSDNPSALARTVEFSVSDGLSSTIATRTLNVTAVNDAPVLGFVSGNRNYTENDGAVVLSGSATITDSDSVDFAGGRIVVSIAANGQAEDRLAVRHEGAGAGQIGVSGSTVTYGGVTIGSLSGGTDGSTPLVITLNGNATPAAVQALTRNLTYENVSDNPSALVRTVQGWVEDGDGGTSNIASGTVTIVAVNDAPTLVDGTALGLSDTDEDTTSFPVHVSTLLFASGYADADNTVPQGLALTGVTGRGTWQYSTDGNTWTDVGTVSGSQALLLDSASYLRYQPDGIDGEAVGFSFRAWDQTSGTASSFGARSTADPGAGGGISAFSSQSASASRVVTPVNDAPTLSTTAGSLNYNENAGAQAIDPGLTVADVDSATLSGATVQISTAYANGQDLLAFTDQSGITGSWDASTGTLTLSGSATLAQYQAALRSITYTNTSEDPSILARTVSFTVSDGSLSSTAATRQIQVVSANDAPTTTDASATGAEDAASIAITLSGSDVDGSVDRFRLNTLPAHGTLYLDAGLSTLVATGTDYAASGQALTLYFVPDANWNGSTSFDFVARDVQGGTDASAATATLTVTAVNDAPVIHVVAPRVTNEDVIKRFNTFIGNAITISDVDAGAGLLELSVSAVHGRIDLGSTAGLSFITGDGSLDTTVTFRGTLAAINAALDGITYVPDADYNGSAPLSFTLNDLGNAGSGGALSSNATQDITVLPINDAPTLSATAGSLSYNENAGAQAIDPGLTVADVDSATLSGATVQISTAYANGQDLLSFTDQSGITGSWDASTGTLTLSGSATLAQYQAALRSITYTNTSEDPSILVRTVSFSVSDGSLSSTAATRQIQVASWNDAPTTGNATTFAVEDTASMPITLSGNDVDGTVLSFRLSSLPAHGSLYLDAAHTQLVVTGTDYSATAQSLTLYFAPDSDWHGSTSFQYTAIDDTGFADASPATGTFIVSALNDAPTGAPVVVGSAIEDQVLSADTSGIADADGLGAFSLQWLRDGVAVSGATASTYLLGDADVGASLSVRVSYTDGDGSAESITSAGTAAVLNVNDAPTGAATILGTPTQGQTLSAATGTLADADGLGVLNYQWLRDGVAISGANAASYTLLDADVGASLRVVVSYTDGQGTAESLTSVAVGPVANVNDAPTGAPVIVGSATEDQILTVDTTSIGDGDGLGSYAYQWLRDGVAIGGATGSSHLLGDADVGATISVRLSYTDGRGSAETLTSAATAPVANVNDVPTGAPQIVGTATEGQTLSVDASSIGDDDGLGGYAVQWLRNGLAVGGATGSSYLLGNADVGATISVQLTYTDGHGTAESLTSASTAAVANVNDAPTGAPLIVGSATEDQTLTVDTSTIADADGLGSFALQWLRNGVAVSGATGGSYTLGDADVGATISVQLSYIDGHGSTESLTSASTAPIANVNDAPTGAPLIVGNATEDQTLSADTSTLADADGLGSFTYQWLRDGVAIGGATGASYTLGDADVGASIGLTVRYTDGQGSVETLGSAALGPVANVNDAPAGAPLIVGSTTEDQTLSADTSALADADGLGSFAYQWLRDGVAISGATGASYTLGDADVGASIGLTVRYTDGHGSVETLNSATVGPVANVNDAPQISSDGGGASASLNVDENTTAVTTLTSVDDDGDPPTYRILGGADAARFQLDAHTGVLSLIQAPDFERPDDADADHVYHLLVGVDDGQGGLGTQDLILTVHDTDEAPTTADGDVVTDEDTALSLRREDFVFNDPDAGARLQAIRVTVLPTGGSLRLDGQAVLAGQLVDAEALDAGRLVFTPDADANGLPYTLLQYRVSDGQSESGPAQLSVMVRPVDDATQLGVAAPLPMDTHNVIQLDSSTLWLRDVDTDVASLHIQVVAMDGGTLERVDAPGVAISEFSLSDLDTGRLRFVADGSGRSPWLEVGVSGSGSKRLQFLLQSDGTTPATPAPPPSPGTPAPSPAGPTAPGTQPAPPPSEPAPQPDARSPDSTSAAPGELDTPLSSPQASSAVRGAAAIAGSAPRSSSPIEVVSNIARIDASAASTEDGAANLDMPDRAVQHLDLASILLGNNPHKDAEDQAPGPAPLEKLLNSLRAAPGQATAVVLSAGFVWWSLRAAGLVASLLASTPVWRHLDPIPILSDDESDDEPRAGHDSGRMPDDGADEAHRDEAASRDLLHGVRPLNEERA